MKKVIIALTPLALILALAISACGKTPGTGSSSSSTPPNEVQMAGADFVQHTLTVKVGQPVIFSDPAGTGGSHFLCIGQNGQCVSTLPAGAPKELAGPTGVAFNAGDPNKSYTFTAPGTYHVACTVHPAMNLTITVQ